MPVVVPGIVIEFFTDEHLPVMALGRLLTARGHTAKAVQVGFKDPSIIVTAEEENAVIITADRWFLRELFKQPRGNPGRFSRAGVIQVPGEWSAAQACLLTYLPLIEAAYAVHMGQTDSRLGVDLSGTTIHIW